MTLVATVLVLPWAKLAIAYFVLIPHKECTQDIYEKLEQSKKNISAIYDVVVSNSKKPIGVCAMVVTDSSVAALSLDKAPDKAGGFHYEDEKVFSSFHSISHGTVYGSMWKHGQRRRR